MDGATGSARRRRIILAEFVVGVVVMVGIGVWVSMQASDLGSRIFGVWLIGAGLNYAPLAMYAALLIRPGALAAELAGIDPVGNCAAMVSCSCGSWFPGRSWPWRSRV